VDEGVVAIEVGEPLLVAGLVGVVELLDDPGLQLVDHRPRVEGGEGQAHRLEDHAGALEVAPDRAVDPRVLHLDRHRPAVAGDRPVDLPDGGGGDGERVPLGEQRRGRGAELALDDLRRQLGRHRRGVLLEPGQRLADVVGQADVEVRRHLAQLHERALHAAQRLGHLLGRPQLELPVQLGLALGAREGPPGPVDGEVRPRPPAEAGQLGSPLAPGLAPDRPLLGLAGRGPAPGGDDGGPGGCGPGGGEHGDQPPPPRPAPARVATPGSHGRSA
jgi:hypothetical protein